MYGDEMRAGGDGLTLWCRSAAVVVEYDYLGGTIILVVQTKLALIVDMNFLVEMNSRDNGVRRKDNLQLG